MAPPQQTFAWIVPEGDAGFAISVPFDQRALFGQARPPVVVSINGFSYLSTIAIMRGETFVPFRRSNRDAAGVAAGDATTVTLALDTAPRTVERPSDLDAALQADALHAAWDRLSFTQQRELVEAIADAKKPETRTRRITAALAVARTKA